MSALTFLTGVKRAVSPYNKLQRLYRKSRLLLMKLPKDAAYRVNTEEIICHRLSVLTEAGDDVGEIEDNIGGGTIEMLIAQAEDEYILIQKMMTWKPWERTAERPPEGQWDWPPAQA